LFGSGAVTAAPKGHRLRGTPCATYSAQWVRCWSGHIAARDSALRVRWRRGARLDGPSRRRGARSALPL